MAKRRPGILIRLPNPDFYDSNLYNRSITNRRSPLDQSSISLITDPYKTRLPLTMAPGLLARIKPAPHLPPPFSFHDRRPSSSLARPPLCLCLREVSFTDYERNFVFGFGSVRARTRLLCFYCRLRLDEAPAHLAGRPVGIRSFEPRVRLVRLRLSTAPAH